MPQSDKLDNLKKKSGKNFKSNLEPNQPNQKLDEAQGNISDNTSSAQSNIVSDNSSEATSKNAAENNLGDGLKDGFKDGFDLSKILELHNQITVLETDLNSWKERALRVSAEMANLQKQHELDLGGVKKSGKKAVSTQLITFLNTLNLAFSFAPSSEDQKIQTFITTLKTSFDRVITDLKTAGVEIILPKPGDEFSAETMSALDVAQNSEENPKVSRIAGVGYKIDGQLVQPASVLLG